MSIFVIMEVIAKFRCESVTTEGDMSQVRLCPVTSGSKENEEFFKYTPGGSIDLSVVNPEAAGQFEPGKEYFVTFTKAEEAPEEAPADQQNHVDDQVKAGPSEETTEG